MLARRLRPWLFANEFPWGTMHEQVLGLRFGALVALALLTGACGDKKEAYVERPVEDIYNQAMDKFIDGNYRAAAPDFDEVDRQHPYSVWATKAQLMSAYSLYQASKYDEASVALDRFIQLHPGNRDTAYAYYLKALCSYVQITDVGRDQKMTEMALKALDEVVRRFPDSKYARDARLKIDLTRDHLAGKEMVIGRYYERQGLYLAAINRFRRVVDNFQTTTHVPEALHRLTESYLALGIVEEARTSAAVLGHNYPGSEWYQDSYALLTGIPAGSSDEAPSKSWITRVIGSVF
jgi:outer membrane protein assembly factor BamD